jgi:hypothetical protein
LENFLSFLIKKSIFFSPFLPFMQPNTNAPLSRSLSVALQRLNKKFIVRTTQHHPLSYAFMLSLGTISGMLRVREDFPFSHNFHPPRNKFSIQA